MARRLGLEDIDRRAGDLAAVERFGERSFVNQTAARAVDDPDRRLHHGDLAGADQVACLGRHRCVQGQEVTAAPEVIEPRDTFDAELECLVGGQKRVKADDRHAETLRPLGHREPDSSQADHAERLALELRAREFGPLPFSRFETVVGLGHVSRQGQQQGHGVLGRGDRVPPRGIHDHDSTPGRGRDVDVIHPHARADDRLEPGLTFQDLGRQLRARSNHDAIGLEELLAQTRRILGQLGINHDLDPRLARAAGRDPLPPACPSLIRDASRSKTPLRNQLATTAFF